ncbi:MAG: hypothetical protein WAR83_08325, partial [Flavobacteriales bacterium]
LGAFGQTGSDLLGCDCAMQRLDDAYCNSVSVFRGIMLSADTTYAVTNLEPDEKDGIEHIAVSFHVMEQLKGLPIEDVIVNTAVDHEACAYRFIPGNAYLVFARKDGDRMVTDRCTPTRNVNVIGQEFLDSLEYVRAGNSWHAGVPLDKSCN